MQPNHKNVKISIIVCTYNLPDSFYNSIDSLLTQSLLSSDYEIIIIHYNISKKTPKSIKKYLDNPLHNIIYLPIINEGLSNARNSGISIANSEIIAFLDDDAVADSGWLQSLVEVFNQKGDAWIVGGKVLPFWKGIRPQWLSDDLFGNLSLLDWGDSFKELKWPERVIGTNIAFKTEVFLNIGIFNPKLGRFGNLLMGSEETEIQKSVMMNTSYKVYYTPKAVVHHIVPPERMVPQYFNSRAYGHGRTQALIDIKEKNLFDALKTLLTFLNVLFWWSLKMLIVKIFTPNNEKKNVFLKQRIYSHAGYIYQINIELKERIRVNFMKIFKNIYKK